MTFRILTVCTGNICRSPMAEQLLREKLLHIPGLTVTSAGTGALVGAGMPAPAAELAGSFGARNTEAHRARQLEPDMVRDADLVLALANEHKRRILEEVPAGVRRTFTLRELARTVEAVADEDLLSTDEAPVSPGLFGEHDRRSGSARAGAPALDDDFNDLMIEETLKRAIETAQHVRPIATAGLSKQDFDVVDPFRKSEEVYAESGRQLVPAIDAIVAYLYRTLARAEELSVAARRSRG